MPRCCQRPRHQDTEIGAEVCPRFAESEGESISTKLRSEETKIGVVRLLDITTCTFCYISCSFFLPVGPPILGLTATLPTALLPVRSHPLRRRAERSARRKGRFRSRRPGYARQVARRRGGMTA